MSFITTVTGKKFEYLSDSTDCINLYDITEALSRIPRFAGHIKYTSYSVLQHSYLVSRILEVRRQYSFMLEGLLHDAHEAYTGDLPTPLKLLCNDFQKIEKNIDKRIRKKYNLPDEISEEVKSADSAALYLESKIIKRDHSDYWENYKPSDYFTLKGLSLIRTHEDTKDLFIQEVLKGL